MNGRSSVGDLIDGRSSDGRSSVGDLVDGRSSAEGSLAGSVTPDSCYALDEILGDVEKVRRALQVIRQLTDPLLHQPVIS